MTEPQSSLKSNMKSKIVMYHADMECVCKPLHFLLDINYLHGEWDQQTPVWIIFRGWTHSFNHHYSSLFSLFTIQTPNFVFKIHSVFPPWFQTPEITYVLQRALLGKYCRYVSLFVLYVVCICLFVFFLHTTWTYQNKNQNAADMHPSWHSWVFQTQERDKEVKWLFCLFSYGS